MATPIDPGKLKPRGFTVIGNISGGGSDEIPWYINDDNLFVLEPNKYDLTGIQIDSERAELASPVVDATPFDNVFVTTDSQVILGNIATSEQILVETVTGVGYNQIPYKYCVRDDIEQIYGRDNVLKWADLDNNHVDADIDARIDYNIEKASRYIDGKLRGGSYRVPFYDIDLDDNIIEICARLAGYKMYAARGITFNEAGFDIYATHKKMVKEGLTDIMNGRIRLDIRKTESYEKRHMEVLEIELDNTYEDVIS